MNENPIQADTVGEQPASEAAAAVRLPLPGLQPVLDALRCQAELDRDDETFLGSDVVVVAMKTASATHPRD